MIKLLIAAYVFVVVIALTGFSFEVQAKKLPKYSYTEEKRLLNGASIFYKLSIIFATAVNMTCVGWLLGY